MGAVMISRCCFNDGEVDVGEEDEAGLWGGEP